MAESADRGSGVIPHLTIPEGKGSAAVEFYRAAFGAEEERRHLDAGGERIMHSHLTINGGALMLNDDFPEHTGGMAPPSGVTLHLQVDDADAWWERALAAGAMVRFPLNDQFWGDRYGQVLDPFGHTWSIGAPVKSPAS